MKLMENPRVPVSAHSTFDYHDNQNIQNKKLHFKGKMQPLKSYNAGLNSGTIKTSGLDERKIGGRYFGNRTLYTSEVK